MKQSILRASLTVVGDDPDEAYQALREKIARVPGVTSVEEMVTFGGTEVEMAIHIEFADSPTAVKLCKKVINTLNKQTLIRVRGFESRPSDIFG